MFLRSSSISSTVLANFCCLCSSYVLNMPVGDPPPAHDKE